MNESLITEHVDPDSPEGWAQRWTKEFQAARDTLKDGWETGEAVVERFLDKRETEKNNETRVNLFTSNVTTLEAMLFGRTPSVQVVRRFADAGDDDARVASEALERLLNADIEEDGDSFQESLKNALGDWLRVGFGNIRWRYECEMEQVPETPAVMHPETGEELAPAVPAGEQKKPGSDNVYSVYTFWKDQLWSPCRTFGDARWWAFKFQMSRQALVERFGEKLGKLVPLNAQKEKRSGTDAQKADPWDRADVWEIWCKETKEVFWYVEGFGQTLDRKPDPLQLRDFWPFPKPLMANTTTSGFIPRPDFVIAQDLYDEHDALSTRITELERQILLRGVYDATNIGLRDLLSPLSKRNQMIPVQNWNAFNEKGGLAGGFQLVDLTPTVAMLQALREARAEVKQLIYEVTGMSDLVRGEGDPNETATAQSIKGRFASVRIQAYQDEFARFASGLQQIKAEIISRHFDPATIIERSNLMRTQDADRAQAAVQLLKTDFDEWRVQVKPENVSLTDFAAEKSDRAEFMGMFAQFVQVMPMALQAGLPMEFLMEIFNWTLPGFKGTSAMESASDRAIVQMQQQQQQAAMQPPPPDPKLQLAQFQAHAGMQQTQMDSDARMREIQAETQSGMQQEAFKAHAGIMSAEAKQRLQALQAVSKVTGGPPA